MSSNPNYARSARSLAMRDCQILDSERIAFTQEKGVKVPDPHRED